MPGTAAKKADNDGAATDPFDDGSDEYAALMAELDVPVPEGWQPNPGDKIAGEVVEKSTANAGGYGDYPMLVLKRANGERTAVHAFHQVLQNELERHSVRTGDRIAIKFEGEMNFKTPQQGKGEKFSAYRVVVDPRRRAELESGETSF